MLFYVEFKNLINIFYGSFSSPKYCLDSNFPIFWVFFPYLVVLGNEIIFSFLIGTLFIKDGR